MAWTASLIVFYFPALISIVGVVVVALLLLVLLVLLVLLLLLHLQIELDLLVNTYIGAGWRFVPLVVEVAEEGVAGVAAVHHQRGDARVRQLAPVTAVALAQAARRPRRHRRR